MKCHSKQTNLPLFFEVKEDMKMKKNVIPCLYYIYKPAIKKKAETIHILTCKVNRFSMKLLLMQQPDVI